jgi:hypothetical protein
LGIFAVKFGWMRLVCKIPHETLLISVFSFNERYVVKFEAMGALEQTYKIPVGIFADVEALVKFVLERLVDKVFVRFLDMQNDLTPLMKK